MKKIVSFEVIDHGVRSEVYFENISDCVTGQGNTFAGAMDNAVELLAQMGYDVECFNVPVDESSMAHKCEICSDIELCNSSWMFNRCLCNSYRYVSIRVKE
jgi:hypothetical protein